MRNETWSKVITLHGVNVRLFERGGVIYRDVAVGRTVSESGKARTVHDVRSLKHGNRERAETQAKALAKAMAEQQLLGVTPGVVTMGELFRLYLVHAGPELTPGRRKYAEACIAMFLEAWGAGQPVQDVGQAHVDRYCRLRRSGELVPPALREKDGKRGRGYRAPQPVRDGTLHSNLAGFLSPVFNWGMRYKARGRRLLAANPLRDCQVPREQNPRRPIASHDRYQRTQEHTDAVDPKGRLRCVLALARYTGRRESAICQLQASDVLLSEKRIRSELAAEGMDERMAAAMPHGAIRWASENDKEGLRFITPVSREARAELELYLARNPRLGDVPLFPAPGRKPKKGAKPPAEPKPEKPLGRETASKWLARAEKRAGLPKLTRGAFHAFRRLWASERKHLPDVDVAAAGGWKDTESMKASYQQPDPETVLRVIERSA
jgi:integrase